MPSASRTSIAFMSSRIDQPRSGPVRNLAGAAAWAVPDSERRVPLDGAAEVFAHLYSGAQRMAPVLASRLHGLWLDPSRNGFWGCWNRPRIRSRAAAANRRAWRPVASAPWTFGVEARSSGDRLRRSSLLGQPVQAGRASDHGAGFCAGQRLLYEDIREEEHRVAQHQTRRRDRMSRPLSRTNMINPQAGGVATRHAVRGVRT